MGSVPGYTLRALQSGDFAQLHAVEASATDRLIQHGAGELQFLPAPTAAHFERGFAGCGTWVAADAAGVAVGYLRAHDIGGIFWIHQVSVHADHAGRGLGRALVFAALDHARWAFHSAAGLSTYRDIAFNAPFYERLGFLRADPASLPPEILARFEAECPPGCPPERRTIMIRKL